MIQRAAGARMLLVTRHGGRGIVQDDEDVSVWRRIVDHFDQSGDAAVDESAIPYASYVMGGPAEILAYGTAVVVEDE